MIDPGEHNQNATNKVYFKRKQVYYDTKKCF